MQHDLLHGTEKPPARDPEAFLTAAVPAWRGIPCCDPKFQWRGRYQELLIPGQGRTGETSLELQLQRDSGQSEFRGYHTTAVFPVWQPEVTTLAAETCPTPELPITEVLTIAQFNLSTANSEVQHLGGPRHIHPPAFSATQTKPFTQHQSRAAGWETSRNTEVSSAANICPRPSPRQRAQAPLFPRTYMKAFGQAWRVARGRPPPAEEPSTEPGLLLVLPQAILTCHLQYTSSRVQVMDLLEVHHLFRLLCERSLLSNCLLSQAQKLMLKCKYLQVFHQALKIKVRTNILALAVFYNASSTWKSSVCEPGVLCGFICLDRKQDLMVKTQDWI